MLTETQCLKKAAEFTTHAEHCHVEPMRECYVALVQGWRRVAALAEFQDKWQRVDRLA